MGERIHELGKRYVLDVQDFLETTGNFHNLINTYNLNDITLVEKIDGTTVRFDIIGIFKNREPDDEIEVFIETKHYSSESKLLLHYKKFIIDSFCVWIKMRKLSRHKMAKFLFIASHPFDCKYFIKLNSYNFLKKVISSYSDDILKKFKSIEIEDIFFKFLNHIDILFLTKSRTLISVQKKNLIEKLS